jgi:hypothetical protein
VQPSFNPTGDSNRNSISVRAHPRKSLAKNFTEDRLTDNFDHARMRRDFRGDSMTCCPGCPSACSSARVVVCLCSARVDAASVEILRGNSMTCCLGCPSACSSARVAVCLCSARVDAACVDIVRNDFDVARVALCATRAQTQECFVCAAAHLAASRRRSELRARSEA